MRYYNHFDCWPHSYMIPFELLEGFALIVMPAIAFAIIVPVLLIKRIRMHWPMWIDYLLSETALLLILSIIVAIFWIFLGSISFLTFASISIVVLPIGGLGVLSCQRVLKKYMKEVAQPATPPYSESAARSPQG